MKGMVPAAPAVAIDTNPVAPNFSMADHGQDAKLFKAVPERVTANDLNAWGCDA